MCYVIDFLVKLNTYTLLILAQNLGQYIITPTSHIRPQFLYKPLNFQALIRDTHILFNCRKNLGKHKSILATGSTAQNEIIGTENCIVLTNLVPHSTENFM